MSMLVQLVRNTTRLINKYVLDPYKTQNSFCEKLSLAPLRFDTAMATWENGKPMNNHSKLIVIDEASFYIGSQNIYYANLQEHGLIVNDEAATQHLLEHYWDPLWENSRPASTDCYQHITNFDSLTEGFLWYIIDSLR